MQDVNTGMTLEVWNDYFPGLTFKNTKKGGSLWAYKFHGVVHVPTEVSWKQLHDPDGMPFWIVGVLVHEHDHYVRELNSKMEWTSASAFTEILRMISVKHRAYRGITAYSAQACALNALGRIYEARQMAFKGADNMKHYGKRVGKKYKSVCEGTIRDMIDRIEHGGGVPPRYRKYTEVLSQFARV